MFAKFLDYLEKITDLITIKTGTYPIHPDSEDSLDVWICPVCSVAYVDGACDMVCCDHCDNWFHWYVLIILVDLEVLFCLYRN